LGVDTAYDELVFKVGRKLCTKLFNASKFAIGRFADIDPAMLGSERITEEADRALIAELRPLLDRATAAFDEFDYAQALSLSEDFFWRIFCDNYLELAKPRTYEEGLTQGRLSACATLRLAHRAVVRLFAPFVPYISEEVWRWAYSGDTGMNESVHKTPWPVSSEFDAVIAPQKQSLWNTVVDAIDLIRKAKADVNKSMAAPILSIELIASEASVKALELVAVDIKKMLKITTLNFSIVDGDAGIALGALEFDETTA
jgi:valyl-tRNA synthetase